MTALALPHGREFDQPIATKPLSIVVTDDGRFALQMHALLRQMTPVLEQPNTYPEAYRMELANRAKQILHNFPDDESFSLDAHEYEPGCWVENDEETETREEPW